MNAISMWHIKSSKSSEGFLVDTMCESQLPIDNIQSIPLQEYSGGRRISICSYCLKETDERGTVGRNIPVSTNNGTSCSSSRSLPPIVPFEETSRSVGGKL